jgi:hypothetical protein
MLWHVCSIGVGLDRHCVSGNDRLRRCTSHCSLGRRGPSQTLWLVALQLRALLWPLLDLSPWAQAATVLAGTLGDVANVASVLLVGVDAARQCSGGQNW